MRNSCSVLPLVQAVEGLIRIRSILCIYVHNSWHRHVFISEWDASRSLKTTSLERPVLQRWVRPWSHNATWVRHKFNTCGELLPHNAMCPYVLAQRSVRTSEKQQYSLSLREGDSAFAHTSQERRFLGRCVLYKNRFVLFVNFLSSPDTLSTVQFTDQRCHVIIVV